MYVAPATTAYTFDATTIFVFDGQWRGDRTGNSRFYPDINGTGTYTPPHAIAVEILTGGFPMGFFDICAIEDDCTTAVHKNAHHGNGQHAENINFHRIDDGSKYMSYTYFNILDDCANDDDIYGDSGTTVQGNPPSCATSQPIGYDIRVCLRVGTITDADSWGTTQCSSCTL
jgi:hypothetical protein